MTAENAARGRRNRAKGGEAERDLARWLKPWYPDATRAIRSTFPDPGDIDCTSPGLWWSVKNCAVEQISAWMAEMATKAPTQLGLLVIRRKGHASPGEWWCLLRLSDLLELGGSDAWERLVISRNAPVRLELRHVLPLLVHANYARSPSDRICAPQTSGGSLGDGKAS